MTEKTGLATHTEDIVRILQAASVPKHCWPFPYSEQIHISIYSPVLPTAGFPVLLAEAAGTGSQSDRILDQMDSGSDSVWQFLYFLFVTV